jgi:hypothetical protein
MWFGTILPALAALAAGLLAWRYETRRLDGRSLYEPRGWDTPEEEFRRQILDRRKRRRFSMTMLSALIGSVVATALLQLLRLSELARGG